MTAQKPHVRKKERAGAHARTSTIDVQTSSLQNGEQQPVKVHGAHVARTPRERVENRRSTQAQSSNSFSARSHVTNPLHSNSRNNFAAHGVTDSQDVNPGERHLRTKAKREQLRQNRAKRGNGNDSGRPSLRERRNRRKSASGSQNGFEAVAKDNVMLSLIGLLIIFVLVAAFQDAYDNPLFNRALRIDLGNSTQTVQFTNFINTAYGSQGDEGNDSDDSSSSSSSSSEGSTASANATAASKDPDGSSADDDSDIVTLSGETKWDHFRHIAKSALAYNDLDESWSNVMLAMIKVESSGNVYIDKYQDIMQTFEGDGKSILMNGVPELGIRATTPEASIYAGALEFSHCIGDFEKYFGRSPSPTDENDIALLTQGYNYGHQGWFSWCARNGVTTWTLSDSTAYQNRIGGVGTANHGGKCKAAYEDFVAQYGEGQ